jgi:mannobiose 2-epimerase
MIAVQQLPRAGHAIATLRHRERPEPPGAGLAERAKDALRRHVVEPLLPRCLDREYGGFLVDFDDRWQPVGPHEKTLEHAARTTIALALIDGVMPDAGCDRLVRHGCRFLQQVMWDGEHGGFFARVDRAGRPLWEGLKHPHAVSYVGRAFLMAERHLPEGEGVAWAKRAFTWLEDTAWDARHGGYWGAFRRDNQRYPAGTRLPTPDGRDIFGLSAGLREINTQGDAIEMLDLLVARGIDGGCADRLERMVELVADRLIDPRGGMHYAYFPDWRPVPQLLRVGYQFQMARHLALVSREHQRGAELVARARLLTDFCLASARHPHGGFCYAVTGEGRVWPAFGPESDSRQWWVHAEAVHTLHLLAHDERIEPEARARYRQECETQWAFLERTFFDERHGGLRALPLDVRRGRHRRRALLRRLSGREAAHLPLKTHAWKDPSHEVAAFVALASAPSRPRLQGASRKVG